MIEEKTVEYLNLVLEYFEMAPKEDPEIESGNHEDEEEVEDEGQEEEGEELEEEDEEEEEEDLVDPREAIKDRCGRTKECKSFSSALNECNDRLEKGDLQFDGETCTEELFNFLHCVDGCAAGSIMKSLK